MKTKFASWTLRASATAQASSRKLLKMTIAGVSLAAVLLGLSSATFAVPLSGRPTGPGIHYFGYYASALENWGDPADGCPSGDYTACIADHANVTHIIASTPAETARRLAEAQQLGMGAIVDASLIFFVGGASASPNANWKAAWDPFVAAIKPYESTIVAFYLVDEPPNWVITSSHMANEVAVISAAFPNAHRMIIFTAQILDDPSWTIPNGLDWVGYDCYPGTFQQCYDASPGWKSIPYYLGRLKSIIRKSNLTYNPGLVLVPQGYIDATDISSAAQANLLARIEREVSMVENDPDFTMIMPFIWQESQGVNALSMVRSYYTGLGKHLTTTTAPMRPAAPTTITASNVVAGGDIVSAFDGNFATAWNSGGYTPQWISAGFVDPLVVDSFLLTPAQSPAGTVRHLFSGTHVDGSSVSLGNYSGQLADGQTIVSGAAAGAGGLTSLTITTDISPSWVGWREYALRTTGTTRVYAYPVSASGQAAASEFISDADPSTLWNAGGYAPQNIVLDLGQARTLSRIELIVAQAPAGHTTHTLSGSATSPTGPFTTIETKQGNTADGQTLVFNGPIPNVRYVRIDTTESPSWVGWREINVYR